MTDVKKTDFDRFWESYPPRKGDLGKTPARFLFEKKIRSGVDPEVIIGGAVRFALEEKANHYTRFIMQAQKWLRHDRWLDYQPKVEPKAKLEIKYGTEPVFVSEGSGAWVAWQQYLRQTTGIGSPCVNFGWWFPSEWPPESLTHAQV